MKLWSISTTVRNPERIRNFLKILKLLEGQPFNSDNQKKYQILLIQHKHYFPKNIPEKFKELYYDFDNPLPYEIAEEIFYYQGYKDPAMRGRQSVNPLNKLGFCVARQSEEKIMITELGKRFIEGDFDIGYIFFKSLLKLQFPNKLSDEFSEKFGFDIQPFIATLHLIHKINSKSEQKGLSRNEFCLFVPSLINYKLIDNYVDKIIEFRKTKYKTNFILEFAKEFYQTKNLTKKQIKNFFEYGDNTMRYFRLTRYFIIMNESFGSDWRIDLEPTRKIEIEQLLSTFSGESFNFNTKDEYLSYLTDISLPLLPFERTTKLKEIAISLINSIIKYSNDYSISLINEEKEILETKINNYSKEKLEEFIKILRELNITIKERHSKSKLRNDLNRVRDIINILRDKKSIRKLSPEEFEKIITEALIFINDEIKIKPNYPIDDNGEPISHASGNQADIECFYKEYNAICEVTLNTSNYQWIRETQPVMRHLQEFEKKYPYSKNYCLFITPKIHIDTLYHFWTSIKFGYDGKKQRIIPLTTEQFTILLETVLTLRQKGKRLSHTDIEDLFEEVLDKTNSVSGHSEWLSIIPKVLNNWKEKITEYEI